MRLRIFCRPRGQHMVCSAAYLCLQSVGNLFGNLAFDAKYVRQLAIIGVGPKMSISCRSYELDIDANLLAGLLDASFQYIRDAKLLGDLRKIRGPALKLLRGCARNYFEIGELRQARQNFILDAFSKVGVRLVVAKIFKWQNCNAFFRDRRTGTR